ncbi:hypothetical protein HanIR_Chr16g0815281 [Helianthus annuus]|nr:hypothetical protein HanIR_Chr16g0815281 [Helianthus annuus]
MTDICHNLKTLAWLVWYNKSQIKKKIVKNYLFCSAARSFACSRWPRSSLYADCRGLLGLIRALLDKCS